MEYKTPNLTKFIFFIKKFRYLILFGYFCLFIFALMNIKSDKFIDNDYFWIQNSISSEKNISEKPHYIAKLSFDLKDLLKNKPIYPSIISEIMKSNPTAKIYSIFNENFWVPKQTSDNGMLYYFNLQDYSQDKIYDFLQKNKNKLKHFVDFDKQKIYFFVLSKKQMDFSRINEKNVSISYLNNNLDTFNQVIMLSLLFICIYILFFLFFKEYLAGILSVLFVIVTTVYSVSIIQNLFTNSYLHISFLYIIISVSILDYIYFFYRWHTYQLGMSSEHALIKSISRNIKPAFWTSFIVFVGIAPLLLLKNDIINMIALSSLLPSIIGYFLNLTFVPVILSFFKVKKPVVPFSGFMSKFSNFILNINRKFVFLFTVVTLIFSILVSYLFLNGKMINISSTQNIIIYKTLKNDLYESVSSQIKFNYFLKQKYPNISSIDDLSSQVDLLTDSKYLNYKLDKNAFREIDFFLDLYNLKDKYIKNKYLIHKIYLNNITDKPYIIKYLKKHFKNSISFLDSDSMINNIKENKLNILIYSLIGAILLISILVGISFNSFKMSLVGLFVNLVPISWFFIFYYFYNLHMNIELFISLAISVTITSDSIIHFTYVYWRNRDYGKTKFESLNTMYFYTGLPILISSFILILGFIIMSFSSNESLHLIGIYSMYMIVLSLFVDFIILPIYILYIDDKK